MAEENAHFAIVADFDDVVGYVAYRDDPEHQRVISEADPPVPRVTHRRAVRDLARDVLDRDAARGHHALVPEDDSGRFGTTVRLTTDELVTIANALDEVSNGIRELDDDDEFAARIGASRDEARRLLAEFRGLTEGPETFPT